MLCRAGRRSTQAQRPLYLYLTARAHPAQRVRCVPSMFDRLGVKVP